MNLNDYQRAIQLAENSEVFQTVTLFREKSILFRKLIFQNLADWNLSKPIDFENGHQMVTFNGQGPGQENLEFSPTYREESFQGLDSENYINTLINNIIIIIKK